MRETVAQVEDDLAALVRRIAEHRDREAFRALFLAYAPRLKGWLVRQGAGPDKAEELAQEALLTVWRKAAYFDPSRAGVSAWLFAIARNLRIDAQRKERSAMAYALCPEPEPEAPASPQAQREIAEREARVRQAIAALPADQLEVIQLSFFLDKPHAEIAQALSLPLGTVKSRLRLALAKLRGQVGDLA